MNNENNFYDILRSKFSSQEQPFDEATWKLMRKMIDDSRAKKRRALFIATCASILLLAGGTFGLIEWKAGSGKSNSIAVQAPSLSASKQNSVVANNHPTVLTTSNSIAENKSNTTTQTTNAQSTTNAIASANNSNVDAAVNPVQKQKRISHTKHSKKYGDISDNTSFDDVSNGTTNGSVEVAANRAKSKTVIDYAGNYPDTASSITKSHSAPPLVQAKPPVNGTAHRPDTGIVGPSTPLRFSDEPRIFNGKKQIISIDAGGSYTGGWGNPAMGKGFNYSIGVGYSHYLAAKWFMKTGIQFSDFGNLSSFPHTYQTNLSSHVINDSIITTKRLYYIGIPVQFEHFFGFNRRFSLGAGGTISYLLGSNSSATTDQVIDNNPPINIVNYHQISALNGYNKLTGTVYGFYRYMLTRHWSAYGMFYFMTPVENKSLSGENLYLKTEGVKLMVSYTL